MPELQDEFDPPFEALEPAECRGPLLFNSPHSGRVYPREFLLASRLDLATLRRSEDSFVGELIEGVVARGHPVVRAHFPRCYVDVNREPYELDPRMFDGRLPSFANTRSMRVAGGLGTVARVHVGRGAGGEVTLGIEAEGDADLQLWGVRRKRDLFERVFGMPVVAAEMPELPLAASGDG